MLKRKLEHWHIYFLSNLMFFQKSVSTKFVCKYYAVDELCIVILTDFLLETLRNEDLSFECCDVGTTLKRKRMVVRMQVLKAF